MARNERTSEQQETAPSGPATFGEVVQTIAEQLGETEAETLRLLRRVVKRPGTEEALAFLHKTLEVEAQRKLNSLYHDGRAGRAEDSEEARESDTQAMHKQYFSL
jgi:hypothetical protein